MNNEGLEIIPGEKLGKYRLDWDIDTLKQNLPEHYTVEEDELRWYVKFDNYRIAIYKFDNKIDSIMVSGSFKEKFKNKIGSGSTLGEIKKECGETDSLCDTFVLDQYPGIYFLISRIDKNSKSYSRDDIKVETIGVDGHRLPPDTDYEMIYNTHYECPFPKKILKSYSIRGFA